MQQQIIVSDLLKQLGNHSFKNEEFENSIKEYEKSLSIFRYIICINNLKQTGIQDQFLQYKEIHGDTAQQKAEISQLKLNLFLNLSISYLKLSDYITAQQAAEEALTIDPKNIKALYRLAKAKTSQNNTSIENYKSAINDLKLAHNINKKDTLIHQELQKITNTYLKLTNKDFCGLVGMQGIFNQDPVSPVKIQEKKCKKVLSNNNNQISQNKQQSALEDQNNQQSQLQQQQQQQQQQKTNQNNNKKNQQKIKQSQQPQQLSLDSSNEQISQQNDIKEIIEENKQLNLAITEIQTLTKQIINTCELSKLEDFQNTMQNIDQIQDDLQIILEKQQKKENINPQQKKIIEKIQNKIEQSKQQQLQQIKLFQSQQQQQQLQQQQQQTQLSLNNSNTIITSIQHNNIKDISSTTDLNKINEKSSQKNINLDENAVNNIELLNEEQLNQQIEKLKEQIKIKSNLLKQVQLPEVQQDSDSKLEQFLNRNVNRKDYNYPLSFEINPNAKIPPEIHELGQFLDEKGSSFIEMYERQGQLDQANQMKEKLRIAKQAKDQLEKISMLDFDHPKQELCEIASAYHVNLNDPLIKQQLLNVQQQNILDLRKQLDYFKQFEKKNQHNLRCTSQAQQSNKNNQNFPQNSKNNLDSKAFQECQTQTITIQPQITQKIENNFYINNTFLNQTISNVNNFNTFNNKEEKEISQNNDNDETQIKPTAIANNISTTSSKYKSTAQTKASSQKYHKYDTPHRSFRQRRQKREKIVQELEDKKQKLQMQLSSQISNKLLKNYLLINKLPPLQKIIIRLIIFIILGVLLTQMFNFVIYNGKNTDSDAEKILDKNFI